jgi:hypothetical protein
MVVKRSTRPEFMYAATRSRDRLEDGGVGSETEFLEMPAKAFFEACLDQDGVAPPFHYFTSTVDDFVPGLAEAACPGWQNAVVEVPAAAHPCAVPAYPSLWIGGRGSTTQAHFDVSNSYFAQAIGRKRFRLWSPEAHTHLRVFPDAHPRARKAQIDIDAALLDVSSQVPPPALDIVLEPGDAIFVPAFWFHHVEAVDASVSVNVFSEARTKLAAGAILSAPLPSKLGAIADRGLQAVAGEGRVRARRRRRKADADGSPRRLRRRTLGSRRRALLGVQEAAVELGAAAAALCDATDLCRGFPAEIVRSRYDFSAAGCPMADASTSGGGGGGGTAVAAEPGALRASEDFEARVAAHRPHVADVAALFTELDAAAAAGPAYALSEEDGAPPSGLDPDRVRASDSYVRGLRELAAAHLLELWAVRCAAGVSGEVGAPDLLREAAAVAEGRQAT